MKASEITEWIANDAIRYVRENKSWSDEEEAAALTRMDEERCSLSHANYRIADQIHELLEQFTKENDLPEEWWLDWFEEDSIIEYSMNAYL